MNDVIYAEFCEKCLNPYWKNTDSVYCKLCRDE